MTATEVLAYQGDREVAEARSNAEFMLETAKGLEIKDEATNNSALAMLASCRKATKTIDALKKRWLDPLNAQVKLIRSDFDAMAAPAREADQILSRKTSDYRLKVQEAARKEQARLNALAEKRQAKAAERAEARGEDAPPVMPLTPTVQGPAKTVATDGGKVTYRKTTHFEIIDAKAVPREWCCPDEKKIGAAARAGIITPDDCPAGIRVWITEEATVR